MEEQRIRLVVGLGNPGDQYRLSRHNMGFMVVDRLSQDCGIGLLEEGSDCVFGKGQCGGKSVIVAKPMTFMNRVGPAVRKLADFFSLDRKDVLVVHDDIDLLFGRIKMKEKGGDGGHNGVKSLITALESDVFARVRIGIGRPENSDDISAYVLGEFDKEQKKILEEVILSARDAVEAVLVKGISEAMNLFHGMKISESNFGRRL